MVHDYREFRQCTVCPNTYLAGHCIACGNTAADGCPLGEQVCGECGGSGEVPTDDPLAPHGMASCPDCADDDTLRFNQRA